MLHEVEKTFYAKDIQAAIEKNYPPGDPDRREDMPPTIEKLVFYGTEDTNGEFHPTAVYTYLKAEQGGEVFQMVTVDSGDFASISYEVIQNILKGKKN